MSANFTPEELKRIAPDEYARIYGEDKPEAPKPPDTNRAKLDEARRLEAETRLINAKRRHAAALRREQAPPNGSTRAARGTGYFIIAVIIAIIQIALCLYLTARY